MKRSLPFGIVLFTIAVAACSDQPTSPAARKVTPLQGALAAVMQVQDRHTPQLLRLSGVGDTDRAEILDALREEIARERRWLDPSPTIEGERERRQEAETFREVLEAITAPPDSRPPSKRS